MKQDSDGGRGRQHGGTRGTKVRRLREDERALGEICQEDGREYKEEGDNNKNSPGMPQRYPTLWALIYSFNLKNISNILFSRSQFQPSSSHHSQWCLLPSLTQVHKNRQLRTIDHHAVCSPHTHTKKNLLQFTNLLIPYFKFCTMPQKLALQITILHYHPKSFFLKTISQFNDFHTYVLNIY